MVTQQEKLELSIDDDWSDALYSARLAATQSTADGMELDSADVLLPASGAAAGVGALRVPVRIARALFPYQREAVEWMWRLHQDRVGGILGDEMGLGKTIMVAALLGSLRHSGLLRPSLVVCPATVISHWVKELTTWYPPLRVLVLHDSSLALRNGRVQREGLLRSLWARGDVLLTTYESLRVYGGLLGEGRWGYCVLDEGHRIRNPDAAVAVEAKKLRCVHRLILTGAPIQNKLKELWSLVDFAVPGRLGSLKLFEAQFADPIAAGGWTHASSLQIQTAVQCALVLRSLIAPYLLRRLKKDIVSVLPTKTEQVLFCRLAPGQRAEYRAYLHSREVQSIFDDGDGRYASSFSSSAARLSTSSASLRHASQSGGGAVKRLMAFKAINVLRKICNHPLLTTYRFEDEGRGGRTASARKRSFGSTSVATKSYARLGLHNAAGSREAAEFDSSHSDDSQGGGRKGGGRPGGEPPKLGVFREDSAALLAGSGKLQVLAEVLRLWKAGGHRALVFCQGRQTLSMLEHYVQEAGYRYLRMDGATPVRDRHALVEAYNSNPKWFLFLLTTRVGGVGINLAGADRVIIFDPDWNPATDIQARERAWRLGQTRHVTIFRLITAGTIEEKMYQRQVYKTALQQRVLIDPTNKRLFDMKDMKELFQLDEPVDSHGTDAEARPASSASLRGSCGNATKGSATAGEEEGGAAPALASVTGLSRSEDYLDPGTRPAKPIESPAVEPSSLARNGDDIGDVDSMYEEAEEYSPMAAAEMTKSAKYRRHRDGGGAASQTAVLQALYGQAAPNGAPAILPVGSNAGSGTLDAVAAALEDAGLEGLSAVERAMVKDRAARLVAQVTASIMAEPLQRLSQTAKKDVDRGVFRLRGEANADDAFHPKRDKSVGKKRTKHKAEKEKKRKTHKKDKKEKKMKAEKAEKKAKQTPEPVADISSSYLAETAFLDGDILGSTRALGSVAASSISIANAGMSGRLSAGPAELIAETCIPAVTPPVRRAEQHSARLSLLFLRRRCDMFGSYVVRTALSASWQAWKSDRDVTLSYMDQSSPAHAAHALLPFVASFSSSFDYVDPMMGRAHFFAVPPLYLPDAGPYLGPEHATEYDSLNGRAPALDRRTLPSAPQQRTLLPASRAPTWDITQVTYSGRERLRAQARRWTMTIRALPPAPRPIALAAREGLEAGTSRAPALSSVEGVVRTWGPAPLVDPYLAAFAPPSGPPSRSPESESSEGSGSGLGGDPLSSAALLRTLSLLSIAGARR
jgi:DNA excision repair protein ERCC-6